MAKSKMPELNSRIHSGQCDSVTGDTLQTHSSSSPPLTVMPLRMISPTSTTTSFDNNQFLPISPPSTPSTSPRDEVSSISWTSREGAVLATRTEVKLREALNAISTQREGLPDTPESTPLTMSPADANIRHSPHTSARQFVQTILPRLQAIGQGGRRYLIEDAGIELVCSGWSGAVLIDTKAGLSCNLGQSRSFISSSSWSSSRMSRTSSASSLAPSPPRRTLLTRIGPSTLDTKDLRSSILDALDHATEKLRVDNVVFVVDRSGLDDEQFRAMVHGLCYVGASVVGHGEQGSLKRQGQASDEEEDVHAPRHVASGFVLLSVDV